MANRKVTSLGELIAALEAIRDEYGPDIPVLGYMTSDSLTERPLLVRAETIDPDKPIGPGNAMATMNQ